LIVSAPDALATNAVLAVADGVWLTDLHDRHGRQGGATMLLAACTDARYFARLGVQDYGFAPMHCRLTCGSPS
jgi:hypothetical protein